MRSETRVRGPAGSTIDRMDFELQQIVERIRAAAADATVLRIRGGGTKDFHGAAAADGVAPLDLRPLAGVTAYEPSELVVTARAGTPLAELETLLAAEGQCLPFEPPHFGTGGTVGGMVAAGWSGPARANVGAVRDYVLGAMLVDGRGEVLSFGGQVMKNVAGYDVSRVLAGSFGTLGVIAQVSLKVLPVAPAEATLRFECTQAEALDLLNGWGGRPLPLNASCWVEDAGRGTLYLRLRGAVAAVEAARAHLGGELQPDAGADWTRCRDQRLPWFMAPGDALDLWRLSVPQTAPVIAPPAGGAGAGDAGPLIEWHGGQRWYRARPGQGDHWRAAARAVGGHATLFRSAAATGADVQHGDSLSPALARIQRALQQEFDPSGVFDRSRLDVRADDATARPARAP